MAVDRRKKNSNWFVLNEQGQAYLGSYDHSHLAVLMDIRDELQTLNGVFRCHNALAIPNLLRAIRRNTAKPRKKRMARKA